MASAPLIISTNVLGRYLQLNAEYYYTNFTQTVIDYDSDPTQINIGNLQGDSYSHTMQIDATYSFFKGFTLTAAYQQVRCQEPHLAVLMSKPLQSKYKDYLLPVIKCL